MSEYYCLTHGKKHSEHHCLFCCICFSPLELKDCNVTETGELEDVCVPCALYEKQLTGRHNLLNLLANRYA
jgi:hypothetical protein